jgi:hypothetical protein
VIAVKLRRGAFMLAFVTALSVNKVSALSCMIALHNSDEVRERLGRAELVVLGKIESTSQALFLGGWTQSRYAEVRTATVFKGAAEQVIKMFVDARLEPGQQVILYARRESENEAKQRVQYAAHSKSVATNAPELANTRHLRADNACQWDYVLADSEAGKLHLSHLSALPRRGSGGAIRIRVSAANDTTWSYHGRQLPANLSVVLERDGKRITVVTNEHGEAQFNDVPAGAYTLKMPTVKGHTLECSVYPSRDCANLTVTDQGLHSYSALYRPDASVSVVLKTVDGKLAATPATFRIRRLESVAETLAGNDLFSPPKSVQFNTSSPLSRENDFREHVAVAPGRYALELLSTKVTEVPRKSPIDFPSFKVTGTQVFSTATTRDIDIRAGQNTIEFKLPASLTPKTITFMPKYSASVNATQMYFYSTLIASSTDGGVDHIAYWGGNDIAQGKGKVITALPGQTWHLTTSDFKAGLEAEAVVLVKEDVTVEPEFRPKKRP